MRDNYQVNYQSFSNDALIQVGDQTRPYGQFYPLANVVRHAERTQAQATQLLGYINKLQESKWTYFGVVLGVGLLTASVGVFFLLKFMRLRKMPATTTDPRRLNQTSEEETNE